MNLIKTIFLLQLLLLTLGLTACAPVQPWQRGNLAKPQMA
ncbi:MAG: DUF4266 domain-containing protein [Methylococcaceae bacterium]|nr:DUF4266 domain-containing protein [Methylococcaceae bacterium]MDZ4156600.1 DUF4266 domain-containing protein [Methylococcales bacterium]MDP2394750.1 DUF4266 domain-containing protein [Methylococcaceae bacterium]MDP3020172.1 DUF4266 domain-containing protein [Methylococcaceae bacterium]MDP3390712.1 DUF4266 domain-containing protein [Methylococcaceae bacterium]